MPLKELFLTIDDGPSIHTKAKVDFLKMHHIPALLYARGEFMKKYPDEIPYAIQQGFLIGNHSYTHPFFSQIPLEKCFEEILRTEELIETAYTQAGEKRSQKIVRLPFADRGAGPHAVASKTVTEEEKVQAIQNFLKQHHFSPVFFNKKQPSFIDSFWDLDTEDYKSKYINDKTLFENRLKELLSNYNHPSMILLVHDFDNNHHLFETTMNLLLKKNVKFAASC